MNNGRPTFGAGNGSASANTNNTTTKRSESGAAWKRLSKRDNSEFLSIRINLSKERLKALLNKEGETIDIGFVAFPNPYKKEDAKRPDFRIFEDKDTNE